MSTFSHQSQPSSAPTWVTHVPASSWVSEPDHAPQDTLFPQPQAQPQLEEQELEPTEPLQAKEFSAASSSPPQDPPESPLQRSERLGHHFQKVSILSDRPPLQPQLSLSLGLIQPQGLERPGAADAQLESQLSQSQGGGASLDPGTQQFMESRFAQDFSGVRVHTDASAVQMNQQIQAQAFTHGQDIYFGAGKFDTGSTEGKQLLAHELTHTVQQTGSKPLQAQVDQERPLAQSGHIPGVLMAYGLGQEASWMQRAGEGFQDPSLVIQRSPIEVNQSTQGQAQIHRSPLDWVLPKELVQAKEMLGTILKGASGVILSILKNPVGFLGNLVTGLKNGFQNFLGNIGQYLQGGLISWLTGALGSTGIEMPKDVFSLQGMFSLVMQVLGATWTQVRGRIVSAIPGGEQAMAALEEGTEIFQVVMKEGIGGLWDYVKDQFGDLQGQVMGQIKDMVVVQGIQQGIKFILSMLNPVSGLVRAAMAIYDVVKFFIERGSQVASLVEAVIGSIKSVANGAVEEAAKLVESALGRSIPVLIGFLSSVAGLGNLVSKVQGIFQKMRQPVDKAVNWLIQKAKDLVKQLGQRLGLGKDGQSETENDQRSEREKSADLDQAMQKGMQIFNTHAGKEVDEQTLESPLDPIKRQHKLKVLEAVEKNGKWALRGEVNPKKEEVSEALVPSDDEGAKAQIAKLSQRADSLEKKIGKPDPAEQKVWEWIAKLQDIQNTLITVKEFIEEDPSSTNDLRDEIAEARINLGKIEKEFAEHEKLSGEAESWRAVVDKAVHVPPARYSRAKHWRGNSDAERRQASMNGGPGQFLFSLSSEDVKQIEREALLTGERIDKGGGSLHCFKTFGKQIGWADGKEAYLLRAEMTSADTSPHVHSHPRLRK